MVKLIMNLAISLDGYICDEDGGYAWIVGHGDTTLDSETQFSQTAFEASCDTIVMGYHSYEDCLEHIPMYRDKQIVVATSKKMEDRENVHFFNRDIVSYVAQLKQASRKNIWLFGGAQLCDAFLKSDLIDSYVIGIIPTLLGKGRRLFYGTYPTVELRLMHTSVSDGIVILKYDRK